jgi:hypothetical protein
MNHPLRCRCGSLRGHVVPSIAATRAVCYCRDCQAYARFLETPAVADADGGTEVVASSAQSVVFSEGIDRLACMSLREGGLLRWYASCCNTPIANTPRNPAMPYVGLVHSCLETGAPPLDRSFGGRRIAVNTQSARNRVRATPLATLGRVLVLMTSLAGSRMSGAYRRNPFFVAGTRTPIRGVRVLSADERRRAYAR